VNDRQRLLEMMRNRRGLVTGAPIDEVQPRPAGTPPVLSFTQERLWRSARHVPAHPVWRVCLPVVLRGPVDTGALRAACDDLLVRHEVLRTGYTVDGDGLAPTVATGVSFPVTMDTAPGDLAASVARLADIEAAEPFDMTAPPLARARLVRFADDAHLVFLVVHRLAYDGWSRGILMGDLLTLYTAHRTGCPVPRVPRIQYADAAHWMRRRYAGDALREGVEHWATRLAGSPRRLNLPADLPGPTERGYAAAGLPIELGEGLSRGLRAIARDAGTTLFAVLFAGLALLLAQTTGQPDVVIDTPLANRQRAEFEPLIGSFANVVALRARVTGELTGHELLGAVGDAVLAAHARPWVPLTDVVDRVWPDATDTDRFARQVMINLLNTPREDTPNCDITLTPVVVAPRTSEYELSLIFVERGAVIGGGLTYASELFSRTAAEGLVTDYRQILDSMVRTPKTPAHDLLHARGRYA
jgi:hypothetical protein